MVRGGGSSPLATTMHCGRLLNQYYFIMSNFFSNFTSSCKRTLFMCFLMCIFSLLASSQALAKQEVDHQYFKAVETDFKNKISQINQKLLTNQQEFKDSKVALASFVDTHLLTIWSSEKTVKGLMGKSIWERISKANQKLLVNGFKDTLQRYVQEGFEHYDQQKLEFVALNFNEKQNRGFLIVKLIPNLLPSFNIEFKVSLIDNEWYLYDALVQGASYISLKKDHFRDLFENQTIDGVINYMNEKNSGYLSSKLASSLQY